MDRCAYGRRRSCHVSLTQVSTTPYLLTQRVAIFVCRIVSPRGLSAAAARSITDGALPGRAIVRASAIAAVATTIDRPKLTRRRRDLRVASSRLIAYSRSEPKRCRVCGSVVTVRRPQPLRARGAGALGRRGAVLRQAECGVARQPRRREDRRVRATRPPRARARAVEPMLR